MFCKFFFTKLVWMFVGLGDYAVSFVRSSESIDARCRESVQAKPIIEYMSLTNRAMKAGDTYACAFICISVTY